MMDAEDIEAAPVLSSGIVTALPEDISRSASLPGCLQA